MADTMARNLPGFTQETLSLRLDLAGRKRSVARFRLDGVELEVRPGRDTVWLLATKPDGGGIAVRTTFGIGPYEISEVEVKAEGIHYAVKTAAGRWDVRILGLGEKLMRLTVSLVPELDLLIPFWPRDLYIIDEKGDPTQTKGNVEAAQRGINTGLCYFSVETPDFGSVLYVQNLTALNDFFNATGTKPDGVVCRSACKKDPLIGVIGV